MSTAAILGSGTFLKITISGTATEVAELTSISGPSLKAKTVDTTNMDSGGVAEKIPGILDNGTVQIEGNLINDTSQTQIMTDLQAKTLETCEIDFPSPSTHKINFSAYWTEFTPDFKVSDRITFKATLEVTGVVTFT